MSTPFFVTRKALSRDPDCCPEIRPEPTSSRYRKSTRRAPFAEPPNPAQKPKYQETCIDNIPYKEYSLIVK